MPRWVHDRSSDRPRHRASGAARGSTSAQRTRPNVVAPFGSSGTVRPRALARHHRAQGRRSRTAQVGPYAIEWLNLLVRLLHVVVAIAWIGASFYFIALDYSLRPPTDPRDSER